MDKTIAERLNDTKRQIAAKILNAVESRDPYAQAGKSDKSSGKSDKDKTTTSYKRVTVEDLKSVKNKIKRISHDLEYPNEQQDTYKNFIEVEEFYNDSLQRADHEFVNKFKEIMADFKTFVTTAISKMESKGLASNRSRSQALDILKDVTFFTTNGYFPEVTIKQQTSRIKVKPELKDRIRDLLWQKEKEDPTAISDLAFEIGMDAEPEQLKAIIREFPVLREDEAKMYLKYLETKFSGYFPQAPIAPAAPAVPAAAAPAAPAGPTSPAAGTTPPAAPPKVPTPPAVAAATAAAAAAAAAPAEKAQAHINKYFSPSALGPTTGAAGAPAPAPKPSTAKPTAKGKSAPKPSTTSSTTISHPLVDIRNFGKDKVADDAIALKPVKRPGGGGAAGTNSSIESMANKL
ncbi:MAG: hypothetical protein I8H98_11255, partial [Moraxellaceae bacterium]|nr:hypothetical protein [Moraxellaceae bacterium]